MTMRRAVIVGVGETEYSRDSGRSELQLAAEASLAAVRDAGLAPQQVDGFVTYTMDSNDELELQRCLGMPLLRWTGRAPFGGVGCCASVQIAAAAVTAGYAEAVIVYRALNGRSGRRYGTPESSRAVGSGGQLHYAMGLDTGAKSYAAETQQYLRRYDVSSEDLGRYVVATRAMAATVGTLIFLGGGYLFCCIPLAFMGGPGRGGEIILSLCMPFLMVFPAIAQESYGANEMLAPYFCGGIAYVISGLALHGISVSEFDRLSGRTVRSILGKFGRPSAG